MLGNKRLPYIGLFVLVLGLILVLTISGLAQTATPVLDPTKAPGDTAVPKETAEITASPVVTTEVTVSPTVTEEVTASPTVTEEVTASPVVTTEVTVSPVVTAEVATSSEVTRTEEAAIAGEAEASEPIMAEDVKSVELTVYNQNLGLVKEVRTLELAKGENEVRYTDVASDIEPTSVHFVSLTDPEGTRVLEQNYEYDIVSSHRLLQKYVDEQIALSTKQGDVYTGTLLSGQDDVILATEQGIKIVRLAQIQEFSFPALPEGLITKPTLVWLLEAGEAGEQDIRVTYLTNGINWRADYIAMLAGDEEALSLTGWVTVDNRSGATYRQAKLKLVAGDIHRVQQVTYMLEVAEKAMPRAVAPPAVEERAFFEYHIYEVKRPVTVRDRQTKQIEFVGAAQVAADKVFVYEAFPRPYLRSGRAITDPDYGVQTSKKVQVRLEFANKEESGLGIPLPKGVIRVYQEDIDGGAELIGEDTIAHTPKDEELSLYLGDAFDIVGERTQTSFRKLGEHSLEESYEITLRNHKEEDVVVRVIEHLFRAQDAEIIESSEGYEMLDATTLKYEIEVEADAEAKITYIVRYRW